MSLSRQNRERLFLRKEKYMIGYKLVCTDNPKIMHSFNTNNDASIFYKEYTLNTIVHTDENMLAVNYGLLIFDTLEHLYAFRDPFSGLGVISEVLEVSYEEEDILPNPVMNYMGKELTDIKDFYELLSINTDTHDFPIGTLNVKKLYVEKLLDC